MTTGTGSVADTGSVWRVHDFRLLWFGQSVSQFGDAVTYLALPLIAVLVLDAGTFQVGLVTSLTSVAWLVLGLPLGAFADRVRRRPLLLTADCGRLVLLAVVPLLAARHALTVPLLAAVTLAIGTLSVLFDVAYPAFVPSLVARDQLTAANGALQASAAAAGVVGPGLGGALVRLVGAPLAVLADAASFAVSAASIGLLRSREPAPSEPSAPHRGLVRGIPEGFRYTFARPVPRMVALGAAHANLGYGAVGALEIVFFVRTVHVSSAVIGAVFAVGGIGGIVGAALSARIARRLGAPLALRLVSSVAEPFILLLPLAATGPRLALAFAAVLVTQTGAVVFNTIAMSTVQTTAAPGILSRTVASIRVLTRGALTVGGLAGGALGAALGVRPALWLAAGLVAAVPLTVWVSGRESAREPVR